MSGSPGRSTVYARPEPGTSFDVDVVRTIKTSLTVEASDATAAFEAAIESGLRFAQPSEWSPVPGGWELVLFGVGETSDTVVCLVREAGARPVGAAAVIAQLTADLDEARTEAARLGSYRSLPEGMVWQDYYSPDDVVELRARLDDEIERLRGVVDGVRQLRDRWNETTGDLVPPLAADSAWVLAREHVEALTAVLAALDPKDHTDAR